MMITAGEFGLVQAMRNPLLNQFFTDITSLASFSVALLLVAGLYFLEDKSYFKLSITGLLTTSVLVQTMKVILSVERPMQAEHLISTTTSSFPSGHSAVAWTLAVILSGKKPGLRPYLYTLAALICFSRFYLGVHFLLDIIAGAVIGSAVGKTVLSREKQIL